MSVLLMAQVWQLDLRHPQQLVLLALADHADDDGSNVYPSTAYTGWKTGYSERQAQRIIDSLEEMGVLIEVRPAERHRPTEYRIEASAAAAKPAYRASQSRGDKLSPLPTQGRHPVDLGATSERVRGDIAVSPEPSKEPSGEPKENRAKENQDPRWAEALEHLRSQVPETTFHYYVKPLEFVERRGDTVVLRAPDHVAAWARENCGPALEGAVALAFGPAALVEVELTETERHRQEREALGLDRQPRPRRRRRAS